MKNSIKAPRLIIALLAVVGAGVYAATMMRGSVNIKNSQAATGQNVSDRVVATAEINPVDVINSYAESWRSRVDVSIPGEVNDGDYIDIDYKNIPIGNDSINIEYKGEVIAEAKINNMTSGQQWWKEGRWKNRIDDMSVLEKDGYGYNATLRVIFNKNVEKYRDVNFSINIANAVNAHLRSLTPFDMRSSISINGNELVVRTSRVPAELRGDDRIMPTGLAGSQWIETSYENGKYTLFRYAFWINVSNDRGIRAGDTIKLNLDESDPIRFSENNSVVWENLSINPFIKSVNKNGVFYSLERPAIEGITRKVSDDGKRIVVTFTKDYLVSRELSGAIPIYVDNIQVIDRSPDKFDIQNRLVKGVSIDALWRDSQGAELSKKTLANNGNIIVRSSDASGEYRPKSNIVVSPSKKIEVSGFLCKNDAFEKFTFRTDIEAGSKFEIKPEEVLAKLPEGYKILNPEILSGEMGYKDIVLEVQACVPEEKKEESPQISEPQNPADSSREEIGAPHTGFSGEIIGLAMFAVSILGIITTFLYNKKF